MNVPFVDLSRIHTPLEKELDKKWKLITTNNNYILGNEVEQFEHEFAACNASKYGIGVANGTDALVLSLKAIGLKPGDEVIIPSHTFIATALGVTYAGGIPVFSEIEEDTFLLDPEKIEQHITKKTKAILPVSLYGQPVDFSAFKRIADMYHLSIVADNCQAHGAFYKKKELGMYGDAQAYSFYPGKNLGAFGDAGMVTTNKKSIEKEVRLLRNIGRTGWYEHPVKGYNSRLDTLQAAILSTKLKHLTKWNTERKKAAQRYHQLLRDTPLVLPVEKEDRTHVYHLFVVRTRKRKQFISYMLDHHVDVSIHYPIPIHKQKAYSELPTQKLPISEQVANEVVSLPMFTGITPEEQEYVAQIINNFFK
jgi:dTDP-4-amino-4,6-dideoxygalactose transaminase